MPVNATPPGATWMLGRVRPVPGGAAFHCRRPTVRSRRRVSRPAAVRQSSQMTSPVRSGQAMLRAILAAAVAGARLVSQCPATKRRPVKPSDSALMSHCTPWGPPAPPEHAGVTIAELLGDAPLRMFGEVAA